MQTDETYRSKSRVLHPLLTLDQIALERPPHRLFFGLLLMMLFIASAGRLHADDRTNQFLFLTLRFKNGVVTLEKASVVRGTLKPQQNSTDAEALVVALEEAEGKERWSLAIADPSIERLEYEDPAQPGVIRSKIVHNDDIEFIARVPLTAGVRHVAVFRKEKNVPPATAGAPPEDRRLLGRIELPKEATK